MSGNEKQRKWKHSESITMSSCTWQTTDLLCHGNAHNCLVSAMQRRHDEDKWKIPKEKKPCLPGHYTLEISSYWKLSALFPIFINSEPQWIMWDTPLWSCCCCFYHQLMTFARGSPRVCENRSSCTGCLCCAPAAAPTTQGWGDKDCSSNLHVKTEETTPRSQSSHNSASEVTDTILYKAWDEPVTQFEKWQRNVVTTSLMSTCVTTIWETSLLKEPLSGTDLTPCFFLLCTVLQLMDHKLGLSLCLRASPLTTERGSACKNHLLTGAVCKSRPKHIFRM